MSTFLFFPFELFSWFLYFSWWILFGLSFPMIFLFIHYGFYCTGSVQFSIRRKRSITNDDIIFLVRRYPFFPGTVQYFRRFNFLCGSLLSFNSWIYFTAFLLFGVDFKWNLFWLSFRPMSLSL